jgi:hypothetical protein
MERLFADARTGMVVAPRRVWAYQRELYTLISAFLFFYQPGVDRQAVMQWLTDNVFGNPVAFCGWGILFVQKSMEWCALLFYEALYRLDIPYFERHRVDPNPWPWKSPIRSVRDEYARLRWTAFVYVCKFHAVVVFFTWIVAATRPVPSDLYNPFSFF